MGATRLTLRDVSQIHKEIAELREGVLCLAKSTQNSVEVCGVPSEGEVGREGATPLLFHQATRVKELLNILKFATVVSIPTTAGEEVQLGTVVTILFNGKRQVWKIGGLSDPRKGRIAHTAPLAESLIGKRVGEEFSFNKTYGRSSVPIKVICIGVDDGSDGEPNE